MIQTSNSKQPSGRYNLEDRTLQFAKRVNKYVTLLPKNIPNFEISKQLVRSAGSIGANYIEANEALSKKKFMLLVTIDRAESRRTNSENFADSESYRTYENTRGNFRKIKIIPFRCLYFVISYLFRI